MCHVEIPSRIICYQIKFPYLHLLMVHHSFPPWKLSIYIIFIPFTQSPISQIIPIFLLFEHVWTSFPALSIRVAIHMFPTSSFQEKYGKIEGSVWFWWGSLLYLLLINQPAGKNNYDPYISIQHWVGWKEHSKETLRFYGRNNGETVPSFLLPQLFPGPWAKSEALEIAD